jgi:RNA recognition motif-containing protein
MVKRLFVGNLAFGTTELALRELFAGAGSVVDAKIVADRDTGRSRGFGFVEMSSAEEARKAIETLDGHEVEGRNINVKEALERPAGGARKSGFPSGGGRAGGGRGGGRRW